MPHSERALDKRAFVIYLCLVCVAIILLIFKVPWQQYVRMTLGYYEDISLVFVTLSIILIPFRLFAVERKGVAPETRKVRFLGPIVDLALDTLYDAALFYSGLFLFHTVFEDHANGLSLDPFLILLLVAGILVYQSISHLYELGCEIFYVQKAEKVVRE